MHDPTAAHPTDPIADFVARWSNSGAAERANYQLFLSELCDILAVPRPDPTRADERDNAYVFEKPVTFISPDGSQTTGRIDLYKRSAFVLEAKQGSDAPTDDGPVLFADLTPTGARGRRGTAIRGTAGWDAAMVKARNQADRYVHALPAQEGNPPFILIVDVGHIIEVYADFSRLGKTYTPFPDSRTHRIKLTDLADESIRKRLATLWIDPLSLDPSRRSAKVTREVAADLATLARSLEASGHHPELVSQFLMRLLFTLFAEDIKLIGENRFTAELKACLTHVEDFPNVMRGIWADMDRGTQYSGYLRQKVLQFNGSLFEHAEALPLTKTELEHLIAAAEKDWSDVEPAIFGTLLERALDTRERHKLGAHYTPRAYVERLVLPTVIEPLREQWEAAKGAAFTLAFQGDAPGAREQLHTFLKELCKTTVLDPACGTGNFLYVTMEHMKRLEGEVRDALRQLGETQDAIEGLGLTVDPHQFLGLEINPRARDIADVVLWIGYLKWHLRTFGHPPNPPILRKYDNIKCQDAVLAYDRKELLTDDTGKPVTRWDGHTTKKSPVTGQEIPDEAARVPVYRYQGARDADWPQTDYVVGNPPFIGNKRMRFALGDGYVDALRRAHPGLDETSDFVMFWWDRAARLLREGMIRRFGLITTNSLTHPFNRKVVAQHLTAKPALSLVFAIPDHPWVEAQDGASVRISMTVASREPGAGRLLRIDSEEPDEEETRISLSLTTGRINADLTVGADVSSAIRLQANKGISFMGVTLVGDGFRLGAEDLSTLSVRASPDGVVRRYLSGRELVQTTQSRYVIDFFGREEHEIRTEYPQLYQWLLERVKPERLQNKRESYAERWWVFGEPRGALRRAITGLPRYISTIETGKHRCFIFLDGDVIPDHSLFAIADDDAFALAILSSRPHTVWSLAAGATLEDRPRWRNVTCFEPFPFPPPDAPALTKIRALGSELDAHRKRQQAAHPDLTITDMYNVLEKLRKNQELTAKDRVIHEQGLVSVLKQIHDDLDAAVAAAYGWPVDLTDEEILQRLVAVNAERAEEEKRGIIRWLRPEFQNPGGAATTQQSLALPAAPAMAKTKPAKKPAWPKDLVGQVSSVRSLLASAPGPLKPAEVAASFKGARLEKVADLLEALEALGQARKLEGGRFAA